MFKERCLGGRTAIINKFVMMPPEVVKPVIAAMRGPARVKQGG